MRRTVNLVAAVLLLALALAGAVRLGLDVAARFQPMPTPAVEEHGPYVLDLDLPVAPPAALDGTDAGLIDGPTPLDGIYAPAS